MTALTLRDDGYPNFKKIMKKGKWIGRVARMPDGTFFGKIGHDEVRCATEREAFDEVGARHFGYPNAAALRAKNSKVRAANRAARAQVEYVAREFLRGNIEPFDRLLGLRPAKRPLGEVLGPTENVGSVPGVPKTARPLGEILRENER